MADNDYSRGEELAHWATHALGAVASLAGIAWLLATASANGAGPWRAIGGVFAFYVGHAAPECVRSVISLGSPLRLDPDARPPPGVKAMYRALAQPMGTVSHQARSRSRSMRAPPPVPSTCIYSEQDGFVPPSQATLDGDPSSHENVRVPGSHVGLGFNRRVLWIVADRLAQPEDAWQPYAA